MTSKKILQLNRIDETEHYVLVPSHVPEKIKCRVKEVSKVRGNCYFVKGVAHDLFDFIYRAIIKLNLKERKLIFSRGAVKSKGRSVSNRVDIYELDWDVGTSILIPRKLNYKNKIILLINGREAELRVMEIVVLAGLMQLSCKTKSPKWCRDMAATVLTLGWKELENSIPAAVKRVEP